MNDPLIFSFASWFDFFLSLAVVLAVAGSTLFAFVLMETLYNLVISFSRWLRRR